MQYIEATSNEKPLYTTVFLAGGITGCRDWQSELLFALQAAEVADNIPQLTVYNPRRKNFPIHDPNAAKEQITWEFNKLNSSDIILFWFSKETLNPIVLYELGRHLARSESIILIGMDKEYSRRQDVEIQSSLANYQRDIYYTLQSMVVDIIYICRCLSDEEI